VIVHELLFQCLRALTVARRTRSCTNTTKWRPNTQPMNAIFIALIIMADAHVR